MPELPDVTVYVECLQTRIVGQPLVRVRLASPFVLRSVTPPLADVEGRQVRGVTRLGKRIVIALERDLSLVMHLMIAGRLRWRHPGTPIQTRRGLAAFDFPTGTLLFTEEGTKKRASIHVVGGAAALQAHDPGGLEVLECDEPAFATRLQLENHTLKRSLTDPHLFSGIGNAYSDEILHRARLSPVKLSQRMQSEEIEVLYHATREVLSEWLERLRGESADHFPEKVTAFHAQMAVHGRHREPCPVCDSPVQRIVRGDHETNYCAKCQNGGRVLADRALSKLLKKDWPRTLEELEIRGMGSVKPD